MILRVGASLIIVALAVLTWALPRTEMGRRGNDAEARLDVVPIVEVGQPLPRLEWVDLAGRTMSSEDLLGHRVLLTFERSVDW